MNLFKMFSISFLFWCFVFIPSRSESCGEVSFNVTSGIVRLPDIHYDVIKDLNCLWFYTAPPGRELLVKVDHVHLDPPRRWWASLKLDVDDQTFELPSKCVRCLSEIVAGQELRVVFTYTTRSSKRGTGSEPIGSFQIRFKAFDPFLCDRPVPPKNGYIITEQRRVGNTIEYRCNPPFELVGNPDSRCRIPKSSPIPEWSEPAPECIIPDCTGGVIHKVAGRGAISNPGYQSKRLLPQRQCRWEIMAGRGERIKMVFTYIQLKQEESTELKIYDGDLFRPLTNLTLLTNKKKPELVTSTNKLIIFFTTGDVPNSSELQGFFIEYWNISGFCFHPGQIENGEIIGQNFTIGSNIRFLCHPNFHLIGPQSAICLPGGRWNVSKPRCHFLNLTLSSYETFGLFEFLVNSRPSQAPVGSPQSSSDMSNTTLPSSSEDEKDFVFSVTPTFTSFSRNSQSKTVETTNFNSLSHPLSPTSTEDSKNQFHDVQGNFNIGQENKNSSRSYSHKILKNISGLYPVQHNRTSNQNTRPRTVVKEQKYRPSRHRLSEQTTTSILEVGFLHPDQTISFQPTQLSTPSNLQPYLDPQMDSYASDKKKTDLNPQVDSHASDKKEIDLDPQLDSNASDKKEIDLDPQLDSNASDKKKETHLNPQVDSYASDKKETDLNPQVDSYASEKKKQTHLNPQVDSYASDKKKETELDPQMDSYTSDKTTKINLGLPVDSYASHNKNETHLDFQADSYASDKNDSKEDNGSLATKDTVEGNSRNEENTTLTEKPLMLIIIVATSVVVLLVFLMTIAVLLYKKRRRSSSGTPVSEKSKNDKTDGSE